MALPTAVKRKADKAREMVAGSRGERPPERTLQASNGEFLNVGSDDSSPSQGAANAVSPVSAQALAKEKAKLESERHLERRDDVQGESDTYIPHALSADYTSDEQSNSSGHEQSSTGTLSPEDSVNAGDDDDLPDFIDLNDWKSRFTALRAAKEGRLADMQRLEQENRDLKAKLSQLEGRAENQNPTGDAARRFELDEETRASLGEDQSQAFDKLSQSVEDRFAEQERQQQAERAKVAERFETNLGSMVPRWREINVDPKFLEWLSQEDEDMGMRRQAMLDAFVREFDAESVAALFRKFAVSNADGQQRNGQVPSPELSSNRAGSGLGAEEQMVEIWDQSEIADFYKAKARLYQAGKLKGAQLEKVMAEEARIRKAMEEGRVDMKA